MMTSLLMQSKHWISLLLLVSLSISGFAQQGGDTKFTTGSFSNNVYRNTFFRFTLEVKAPWQAVDENGVKRSQDDAIKAIGRDMGTKTAEDVERAFKTTTFNLLTLFKPDPKRLSDIGSVAIGAERIDGKVLESAAYIAALKKLLQMDKTTVKVGEAGSEMLGGQQFSTLWAVQNEDKIQMTKKIYAKVDKGYALFFVFAYAADGLPNDFKLILDSTKFE